MPTSVFHTPRAGKALKPSVGLRTRLNCRPAHLFVPSVFALLMILFVGGCGSSVEVGPSSDLSRQDRLSVEVFVETANVSCRANKAEVAKMTVAARPHFSLRQILARARRGLRKLEWIKPPQSLARDFQRFSRLLNQRHKTGRLLVESAKISEPRLDH